MARTAQKLRTVGDILEESAAPIGHNQPPPFEAWSAHIDDLMAEGRNFLDGAAIGSDAEAESVSKLLDAFRTAGKDADKARAEEKKPHDDAAKAVQSKWKPLLDRCSLAADTCKRALTPWLQAKEDEQRRAAEAARIEAERQAEEARQAHLAAQAGSLAQREAAEQAIADAVAAEARAARLDKEKAHATGGARAVTLRSRWDVEITDRRELLRHYIVTRPADLEAWCLEQARADVRAGIRSLPGTTITEHKEAV